MKRAILLIGLLVLAACGSQSARKSVPSSPTPSRASSPIASATTTTIPLGRWAAAAAYDETRHAIVMFGGIAGETLMNDTWTWDGNHWTQRPGLTASPSARQGAAMGYDLTSRQVILFGGLSGSGRLNDTWAWDGTAWQALSPAHSPAKRDGASMAFDPALGALVLYGGLDGNGSQPQPINDSWSWQGTDWSALKPAQSPAGGVRARLALLSGPSLLERYGDCAESHDRNLYEFDGHTWTAKPPSGSWPPALCLPSLAGDTSRHQVLLFGGSSGAGTTSTAAETWTYDGKAWTKAIPSQVPPARFDASLVYDADRHLLVLFGGQGLVQGQAGPLNDTWTWDGGNWTPHQ